MVAEKGGAARRAQPSRRGRRGRSLRSVWGGGAEGRDAGQQAGGQVRLWRPGAGKGFLPAGQAAVCGRGGGFPGAGRTAAVQGGPGREGARAAAGPRRLR